MTLIITARTTSFALVTADGRSSGRISSNTFQKIFPHSDRGIAIAHHGQNMIDERRVEEIATEFLMANMNEIRESRIGEIAKLFVQRYGNSINRTLQNIPDSKYCGILFVGFGIEDNEPRVYEANWKKTNDKEVRHDVNLLGDFIRSGDGKKYIDEYFKDPKNIQFLKNNILKWNIEQTKAYCDKIYGFAENNQTKAGEDIFGGYKHQLIIKKSGCEWLIPPKQASPLVAGQ